MLKPTQHSSFPPWKHATFNYASLEADVRDEVARQAAAIRDVNSASLAGRIEIGRRLLAIRKVVAWFDFQPLVESEFGWSAGTTSNYKNVARAFGNLKAGRLARFDWSALIVLSRDGVPPAARIEALQRARAGENIGKSLAEGIVARHRHRLLPDPEAERVVNHVFQALGKFECHKDRISATQRSRVLTRLITVANLLNQTSAECSADRQDSDNLEPAMID